MIELCLTNLGKYNEGELVYTRLVLPATTEEIETAYDKIGVADNTMYEEAFISDYETDINGLSISEYASIDDLNELAEELENFDEYELEAFGAMLEYGLATDEALQKVQDNEYRLYDGSYSMAEVAELYADETGLLSSLPDDMRMYFDFEAFGRDMDINGHFIETDSGIVEIINY
jgi:antirestriction protein